MAMDGGCDGRKRRKATIRVILRPPLTCTMRDIYGICVCCCLLKRQGHIHTTMGICVSVCTFYREKRGWVEHTKWRENSEKDTGQHRKGVFGVVPRRLRWMSMIGTPSYEQEASRARG